MTRWWVRLRDLLDARALRERVLIFAAVAVVLGLAAYEGLLRPVMTTRAELERRTDQVRQEARGLQARLDELAGTDYEQRRSRLRDRIKAQEQELAQRRRDLGTKVGRFIRPDRLMRFFEDVLLARDPGGIRVLRVESQEREPVELGPEGAGDGPGIGLYRKGVAVGYRGNFDDTLGFLDRIEALDWAVQITELDYRVVEFPRAEVRLTAHTFVLETSGNGHGD